MQPIAGKVCAICGERVLTPYAAEKNQAELLCLLCQKERPKFTRATAYGSYEAGLRELIHLLKYNGVRPAAHVLGKMLAEAIAELQPAFASAPVAMVPVPLYKGKRRERGFNQTELIARAALKALPKNGRIYLADDLLRRQRQTKSQIGLTRPQRQENMRGAFAVANPEQIKGREVLIVDDVYTTGTTVSECSRVLLRAGATRVWVATVARTMKVAAADFDFQDHGELQDELEEEIA
jgi:ComF family protein